MTEREFETACRDVLGAILGESGFVFQDTFVRPRGIAVEFRRDDEHFFAVNEGDVLLFDLIRCVKPNSFYRLSLNQMLWSRGVRSLLNGESWSDQLITFELELRPYCSTLFSRHAPALDNRFCFPMSQAELTEYLFWQRGKDEVVAPPQLERSQKCSP